MLLLLVALVAYAFYLSIIVRCVLEFFTNLVLYFYTLKSPTLCGDIGDISAAEVQHLRVTAFLCACVTFTLWKVCQAITVKSQ